VSIWAFFPGMKEEFYQKTIAHVNRKNWWHVPPRDPSAYRKRGKFLASSFKEAEFWGRPLDEPQKVAIFRPLIGDEQTIEKNLFGQRLSSEGMTMDARWKVDAKIKKAALTQGYDAVLLMTSKAFTELKTKGKMPRSSELNVFKQVHLKSSSDRKRTQHKRFRQRLLEASEAR